MSVGLSLSFVDCREEILESSLSCFLGVLRPFDLVCSSQSRPPSFSHRSRNFFLRRFLEALSSAIVVNISIDSVV